MYSEGLCIPSYQRRQEDGVKPLVIGHGHSSELAPNEKFRLEFDWTGTRDPSPWLCIPHAIKHVGSMVPWRMDRNNGKSSDGNFWKDLICEVLDTTPPTPDFMISSMSSVEFPSNEDIESIPLDGDPIHNQLYDEHRIQVPVISWPNHNSKYIRISAQLYNSKEEYEYLSDSLISILGL